MYKKIKNYFKYRKQLKIIKENALNIYNELNIIIQDEIDKILSLALKKDLIVREDLEKLNETGIFHMEGLFYGFWLFIKLYNDERENKKILLDEIHNIFYGELKKQGVPFKLIEEISSDINKKYKYFNSILDKEKDLNKTYIGLSNEILKMSKGKVKINDLATTTIFLKDYSLNLFQEFDIFINELNEFLLKQKVYNIAGLKF